MDKTTAINVTQRAGQWLFSATLGILLTLFLAPSVLFYANALVGGSSSLELEPAGWMERD